MNTEEKDIEDKDLYQIVNETYYHIDADKECVRILEHCRKEKIRVVITSVYGEGPTAESTIESGYVRRTTGSKAAPILVYNERSMGGFLISTDCIVKIQRSAGKQVIYEKKLPTVYDDDSFSSSC